MKAQEKLQRYRTALEEWLRYKDQGINRIEPSPATFGIKALDEQFMARVIHDRTVTEHEKAKQ